MCVDMKRTRPCALNGFLWFWSGDVRPGERTNGICGQDGEVIVPEYALNGFSWYRDRGDGWVSYGPRTEVSRKVCIDQSGLVLESEDPL